MSHQINGTYDAEMENHVPILTPTADISLRLKTLAVHFTSHYNTEPAFFVRVPGR